MSHSIHILLQTARLLLPEYLSLQEHSWREKHKWSILIDDFWVAWIACHCLSQQSYDKLSWCNPAWCSRSTNINEYRRIIASSTCSWSTLKWRGDSDWPHFAASVELGAHEHPQCDVQRQHRQRDVRSTLTDNGDDGETRIPQFCSNVRRDTAALILRKRFWWTRMGSREGCLSFGCRHVGWCGNAQHAICESTWKIDQKESPEDLYSDSLQWFIIITFLVDLLVHWSRSDFIRM